MKKAEILKIEILERSVSQEWMAALQEWTLDRIWMGNDPGKCLCTHNPIREHCLVVNKKNGKQAIVGNCCVQTVLGLDSASIFAGLKRIYANPFSGLSDKATAYFAQENVISNWEKTFTQSNHAKKLLTLKQWKYRLLINSKAIKFAYVQETSANPCVDFVLAFVEGNISANSEAVKKGMLFTYEQIYTYAITKKLIQFIEQKGIDQLELFFKELIEARFVDQIDIDPTILLTWKKLTIKLTDLPLDNQLKKKVSRWYKLYRGTSKTL